MSRDNSNWLDNLFISEAKPALKRHSNSGGGELDIYIEGSPTLVRSNNATAIAYRAFF